MKKLPLLLACAILLFTFSTQAQLTTYSSLTGPITSTPVSEDDYHGSMSQLYLFNTGIARVEAMGKTAVAESNSAVYALYNPALLGDVKDIEVQGGYMNPTQPSFGGNYLNFTVAGKVLKRTTVAATMQRINYRTFLFTDELGTVIRRVDPYDSRYQLALSHRIIEAEKHLVDAGAAINYSQEFYYKDFQGYGFTIDAGLRYSYKPDSVHQLSIGLSSNNMLNQPMHAQLKDFPDASDYNLPQVLRAGVAYHFTPRKEVTSRHLRLFDAALHLQYDELLNSDFFTAFKGGAEIKLAEILALRAGYYTSEYALLSGDFAYTGYNEYKAFTYGAGIEIPFEKLLKSQLPLLVGFDYCSLPFYSPTDITTLAYTEYKEKFTIFNARAVWKLR